MPASECHALRSPAQVRTLALELARGCRRPELVAVGLAELIMNGIEHGLAGLGFEGKRALLARGRLQAEIEHRLCLLGIPRAVLVRVDRFDDLVRFTISDGGAGFDIAAWQDGIAGGSGPNGRGLAVARTLCFESLNFRNGGSEVEAIALRAPQRPSVTQVTLHRRSR